MEKPSEKTSDCRLPATTSDNLEIPGYPGMEPAEIIASLAGTNDHNCSLVLAYFTGVPATIISRRGMRTGIAIYPHNEIARAQVKS